MADGTIDVHVDGLRELGTGLTTLAGTLGTALETADSLPIEALVPVVGPVGGEFMAALLAATQRHRDVLAGVARVTDAAGDLIVETARLYEDTDAAGADAIRAAGTGTGTGTGTGAGTGTGTSDVTTWEV